MFSRCAPFSSWRMLLAALFCIAIWSEGAANRVLQAQIADPIVRIEEDWELVVGTPDPVVTAPQVICTISPTGDVNGLYAAVELNHRSQTSFSPGGLQLQVWSGENLVTAKSYTNNSSLSTAGEVIRWTQTMTLTGTNLTFEVLNGSSTTWGQFGGQGYLKAIVQSGLSDLNAYHPDFSVQNSGVSFAGNRVASLVLKEVRLITAAGIVLTDSTPRTVHSQ